jgi:hypothetical protein
LCLLLVVGIKGFAPNEYLSHIIRILKKVCKVFQPERSAPKLSHQAQNAQMDFMHAKGTGTRPLLPAPVGQRRNLKVLLREG